MPITKIRQKERCPYLGKLSLTFLAQLYNTRYLKVKQRTINKILLVYPIETKLALKNLEGFKVLSKTIPQGFQVILIAIKISRRLKTLLILHEIHFVFKALPRIVMVFQPQRTHFHATKII